MDKTIECSACGDAVKPGAGALLNLGRPNGYTIYSVVHYKSSCLAVMDADQDEVLTTV